MFDVTSIARSLCVPFLILVAAASGAGADERVVSRIAFGSCARHDVPQPIWDAIVATRPDVFVFLGDNIYGDSEDPATLQYKWNLLGIHPGYQKLRASGARVLAIWDDHDYGANDAGKEYPKKHESKRVMLDFFGEPADSPRRARDGNFDAVTIGPQGQRVQFLLLDTRWFRDPLARAADRERNRGPYTATDDPTATLLGPAQWDWLDERLREPADLRIIATSIQFVASEHGWEKWANFPTEQRRLIELIRSNGTHGVLLISGDRHAAELSRLDADDLPYPLYDVTSSSLNAPLRGKKEEPNRWRHGELYGGENFGLIEIDWGAAGGPTLALSVRDLSGKPVVEKQVRLSDLRPR
jgi:alkaline phosphatase D